MSGDSLVSSTVSPLDRTNNSDNFTVIVGEELDLEAFFGYEFARFHFFYRPIHGYLSLAICVFGIIANVLNIIVLTRGYEGLIGSDCNHSSHIFKSTLKVVHMMNNLLLMNLNLLGIGKNMISPTNAILTGMAVTDMFVIASYIPFAIHNFIRIDTSEKVVFTYGWAIFTLFHAHFTVVCHTISIWLTVILAIWRYLAVSSPTNSKTWCSMKRAKYAILWAYVLVPCFCLPLFLSFTIDQFSIEEFENHTFYRVDFSDIAVQNDELLKKLNFWVFSVLLKLIPCISLTILSLALIRVLVEAKKRKQRLHTSNIAMKNSLVATASPKNEERIRNPGQQSSDRTTKMLIAVLIMFLVCEFPSGILALLSGFLGKVFFRNVYNNFGDLMDMLALINSAVNFVLYCLMSQQFRKTFTKLFCLRYETLNNRQSYHLAQSFNPTTCNTATV